MLPVGIRVDLALFRAVTTIVSARAIRRLGVSTSGRPGTTSDALSYASARRLELVARLRR